VERVNLYRSRDWTCACTGKTGLTYEEAALSEARSGDGCVRVRRVWACAADGAAVWLLWGVRAGLRARCTPLRPRPRPRPRARRAHGARTHAVVVARRRRGGRGGAAPVAAVPPAKRTP
jgi:hypothetical protein